MLGVFYGNALVLGFHSSSYLGDDAAAAPPLRGDELIYLFFSFAQLYLQHFRLLTEPGLRTKKKDLLLTLGLEHTTIEDVFFFV